MALMASHLSLLQMVFLYLKGKVPEWAMYPFFSMLALDSIPLGLLAATWRRDLKAKICSTILTLTYFIFVSSVLVTAILSLLDALFLSPPLLTGVLSLVLYVLLSILGTGVLLFPGLDRLLAGHETLLGHVLCLLLGAASAYLLLNSSSYVERWMVGMREEPILILRIFYDNEELYFL
jgi:hypothetical protein